MVSHGLCPVSCGVLLGGGSGPVTSHHDWGLELGEERGKGQSGAAEGSPDLLAPGLVHGRAADAWEPRGFFKKQVTDCNHTILAFHSA
jgi:hypothetical protein